MISFLTNRFRSSRPQRMLAHRWREQVVEQLPHQIQPRPTSLSPQPIFVLQPNGVLQVTGVTAGETFTIREVIRDVISTPSSRTSTNDPLVAVEFLDISWNGPSGMGRTEFSLGPKPCYEIDFAAVAGSIRVNNQTNREIVYTNFDTPPS